MKSRVAALHFQDWPCHVELVTLTMSLLNLLAKLVAQRNAKPVTG